MTQFSYDLIHGVTAEGIPILPPWWTGPNIQDLVASFGAQLDAMSEQALYMRLQSNPYAGGPNATRQGAARLADGRPIECEPFALAAHAQQRGIPLYPSMGTLARRVNISRWLQAHAERGTNRGELRHLQPYFLPGTLPTLRIFHQSGGASPMSTCHELSAAGVYTPTRSVTSNWNWDNNGIDSAVPLAALWAHDRIYAAGTLVTNNGALYLCITAGTAASSGGPTGTGQDITDNTVHWQYRWAWSRWWAVIYLAGVLPQPALWDDGIAAWDDGVTFWDGIDSATVIADWISMLRDWGGAHAACWGVGITWADPAVRFPPTGTSTTDPTGWTSRPVGNYGLLSIGGANTRPPDVAWIFDRSQP